MGAHYQEERPSRHLISTYDKDPDCLDRVNHSAGGFWRFVEHLATEGFVSDDQASLVPSFTPSSIHPRERIMLQEVDSTLSSTGKRSLIPGRVG